MNKTYLVLLIDKKHTKFFILRGQSIERIVEKHAHIYVPQKVKHGDDTGDAQDKIFRHIQNHLHRYLQDAMREVMNFVGKEQIDGVFIGSHKTLFSAIRRHLPHELAQIVYEFIVIDLKMPFNMQLEKIRKVIHTIEQKSSLLYI